MIKAAVPGRVLWRGGLLVAIAGWLGAAQAAPQAGPASQLQVIEREGVRIEVSASPVMTHAPAALPAPELREAEYAELSIRITDLQSGRPVTGLYPAAWMDLAARDAKEGEGDLSCREKIGLFAKGTMAFRPLLDLNSYFILTMNRDSSISVLDPIMSLAGVTSTYGMMFLRKPAADWAYEPTSQRLFVSMPAAGQLGVFDMQTLKLVKNIEIGARPVRVALQPDGRRLWVGDDLGTPKRGGVVAVDTDTLEVVARIETGAGHHDLAIAPDGGRLFVTNSADGTVSVIDTAELRVRKEFPAGAQPVSVAVAQATRTAVIASRDGTLTILDADALRVRARLQRPAGLRMVRFSPDERWVFTVNTDEHRVEIFDAATDALRHTLATERGPDQVTFTPAYAYVRALGSPYVNMIQLEGLERDEPPPVLRFAAGVAEPGKSSRVGVDGAITMTNQRHSVLVTNPTGDLIFYYMEGMNAPMGSFRNLGHYATSVAIVDRSMQERAPGHYIARVRIPTAGTYDLALLLDTPRLTHCFSFEVAENPAIARDEAPRFSIVYDERPARVDAGSEVLLRFRLQQQSRRVVEPVTDAPVSLSYFLAPGHDRQRVEAQAAGDGYYEAKLQVPRVGAYYVFVESAALGIALHDLPPAVIRTEQPRSTP